MDRIDKSLDKLPIKEQIKTIGIIKLIQSKKWDNLDRKKLKGYGNIYRVRSGQVRIIYQENKDSTITILDVGRRNNTTYNL
ncbi:MAG: type II toxin-antitoxin system RelE/ParE family toxin [bacterium]|nr:type II toxin-antitoxin system RelE/ParE family toxin [bacterium]